MMVAADGSVVGSVSGGCVEGAVYDLGLAVLGGAPATLSSFGDGEQSIFAAGLTCGGELEVFIEPVSEQTFPDLESVVDDVRDGRPVAVATVVAHPDSVQLARRMVIRPDAVSGSIGDPCMDGVIVKDARELLSTGSSTTLSYSPDGEHEGAQMRVFVETYQPRPRLVVFGAIDFAAALARQGFLLGFHVTVCDARAVFATPERFPEVDELIVSWPDKYLQAEVHAGRIDNRTALCVLTHEAKFDVPLLEVALELTGDVAPAFIGAMGSLSTHADRTSRLEQAGLGPEQLARLSSPIGLDLGGRTAEETALSIMAEIIALRHGGTGQRLTGSGLSVHGARRT